MGGLLIVDYAACWLLKASQCDPACYNEIREAAKSVGVKMMYPPKSCATCKMPRHMCHCNLFCGNCNLEYFRKCQMEGCIMPGKPRPHLESPVRKGHVQAWIVHNKDPLYAWSKKTRCCSNVKRDDVASGDLGPYWVLFRLLFLLVAPSSRGGGR